MRVIGQNEKPKFLSGNNNSVSAESAIKENRDVYIPELNKYKKIPVYDGDKAIYGAQIKGPCIIEKITTSIFVSENYDCIVDNFGSIIVYEKGMITEISKKISTIKLNKTEKESAIKN